MTLQHTLSFIHAPWRRSRWVSSLCLRLQTLGLSVTRLSENKRTSYSMFHSSSQWALLLLSQNGSINPWCVSAYSFVCGFQQGLSSNIHSFFKHLSLVHPYLVLGHSCMWLVNFWKCAVYVNPLQLGVEPFISGWFSRLLCHVCDVRVHQHLTLTLITVLRAV